jgi:MurNAc alpha-1-phosphate uridylyltransferase
MTGKPQRAMVLAAGLGKRMRPLTDTIPKPMVEVAGRALIDHVLDRFAAIDMRDIVVNLHHLRAKLEAHLKARRDMRITLSPEAELLETGGGVTKALPLLGDGPFFAANADVLWYDGATPALTRLAEAWDEGKMDALLLLQRTVTAHGYDGLGDYFLDSLGRAKRRRGHAVAPYVFAGVQILHPRLFKEAPQGAFSLNRLYDRAEEAERLYAVAHDGLWFHVGTPDSIAATEAELDYGPPPERRAAAP